MRRVDQDVAGQNTVDEGMVAYVGNCRADRCQKRMKLERVSPAPMGFDRAVQNKR